MSPERAISSERPRGWPREFAASPADREALLILSHLESLTPGRLHELAWHEGSASRALQAVKRGAAGSDGDREWAGSVSSSNARASLVRVDARMLTPADLEYPESLLDLPDPPAALFVRGEPLQHLRPAVAVVGARRCSAYGEETAAGIGRGLAAAGVTVVSGAAWGIDEAAHRGALAASGRTAAVLGSGIDVPYPRRNRGLIGEIAQHGSVVAEYPPGVEPMPRRFPARNRIVAALAFGVVVVEGAEGSGSMITAEFALDLGREVFAVPGPVTSPLSAVPNALIREGATLVRGPDDVLAALGMREIPRAGSAGSESDEGPSNLSPEEKRIFDRVLGEPVTAEAVARDLGLAVGPVLATLAGLELRGLVRGVGGRYERIAPPS